MRRATIITAAAAAALASLGEPTSARERHPRAAPSAEAPAQPASRFYPEEIEGGVTGNLPFNNQIRKLKDPLNANGAK